MVLKRLNNWLGLSLAVCILQACAEGTEVQPSGAATGGAGGGGTAATGSVVQHGGGGPSGGAGGRGGTGGIPVVGGSGGTSGGSGGTSGGSGGTSGGSGGRGGSGGSGGSSTGGAAGARDVDPSDGLQIEQAAGNSDANQIRLNLILQNNGDDSVELAPVTIRYWFSSDGVDLGELILECYYVGGLSGANLTGDTDTSLHQAPDTGEPTADAYAEYAFSDSDYTLPAHATTDQNGGVTLGCALHPRSNWDVSLDWDNDWSNIGSTGLNDRITVYVDGSLVWGDEPGEQGQGGAGGGGGQGGQAGSAGASGGQGGATGGTAGTAGTSGSGGVAGTGGSSGSAGQGGAAGTAGLGGTSGAAGVSGSAGTAGIPGAAGSGVAGAGVAGALAHAGAGQGGTS